MPYLVLSYLLAFFPFFAASSVRFKTSVVGFSFAFVGFAFGFEHCVCLHRRAAALVRIWPLGASVGPTWLCGAGSSGCSPSPPVFVFAPLCYSWYA